MSAARREAGSSWRSAADNGAGAITAIKYRSLDGTSHDSTAEAPSTWLRPIVVGKRDSLDWIIAEGETDAARLWDLVGDVAQSSSCLPAPTRSNQHGPV